MIGRYIPDWLRRTPAPGARSFAILAGLDATARAILSSVWPLVMYNALGSAETVSGVYLAAGIASLVFGTMIPWLGRTIPRRWLYTIGSLFYLAGPGLAVLGGPVLVPLGMVVNWFGTVTCFIAMNAYLMDYIARHEIGRAETMKLVYSALPWAVGPVLGVTLWKLWAPLPFLATGVAAVAMLATFWAMRMGNGRVIVRATSQTPNPVAYIGRFVRQPRLVAGWLFAVVRSVGWWVYVVYLPIFCIESGLGDRIASYAYSLSNTFLFLSPLILRWLQRRSLRAALQAAFAVAAVLFLISALADAWPPLAVIAMVGASVCLVALDVYGGLPFLISVRPAERTEMSAVYSSFRDVSSVVTPGLAWLVLLVAPVTGVFAVTGVIFGLTWVIAGRLHPRLGRPRGAQDRAGAHPAQ